MVSTGYKIKRLTIQLLYQFDVCGYKEIDTIRASLEGSNEPSEICQQACNLAHKVWALHSSADTSVEQITPDWPTHRQPPLDRAILRLSYYEMTQNIPIGLVINDAVKLAKEFCSDQSPGFINGVLDKIAKTAFQYLVTDPKK